MAIQQLITKLSVQGAAEYKEKLKTAQAATDTFATAAHRSATRLQDALGSALRIGTNPLAMLGGAAAGAGVIALGVNAAKTAMQYEQLSATFEVLTGSADRAARKLDFIRKLSGPATQTEEDLQAAGLAIESFGLRIERVLPLAAKLQAAFPQRTLSEVAGLFGRLAQGDFPDIEALSGVGLSRQQFKAAGLKFDPDNKMLSSADEALTALERIINMKYGNLLQRMAGTGVSKLASLQNALKQLNVVVGNAVMKVATPAVEGLTKVLKFLTESGIVTKVSNQFAAMFGLAPNARTLAQVVGGIAATFLAMPRVIGNMVQSLSSSLATIFEWGKAIFGVFAGIVTARVITGVLSLANAFIRVAQAMRQIGIMQAVIAGLKGNLQALLGAVAGIAAGMAVAKAIPSPGIIKDTVLGFAPSQFKADQQRIAKLFAGFTSPDAMPADAGTGDFRNDAGKALNDTAAQTVSNDRARTLKYLAEISQNTNPLKDFAKDIFGGGDLGRMGVTPVELAGAGRGGNAVTIQIMGGNTDQLTQQIIALKRRGIL